MKVVIAIRPSQPSAVTFGGGSGSAVNTAFVSLKPEGHGEGERSVDVGARHRAPEKLAKPRRGFCFLVLGQDAAVGGRFLQSPVSICP